MKSGALQIIFFLYICCLLPFLFLFLSPTPKNLYVRTYKFFSTWINAWAWGTEGHQFHIYCWICSTHYISFHIYRFELRACSNMKKKIFFGIVIRGNFHFLAIILWKSIFMYSLKFFIFFLFQIFFLFNKVFTFIV